MEPNPNASLFPNPSFIPQRSRFEFSEPREPHIFFNSNFDSGNMGEVKRNAYDHYSIWAACDAQGTPNEGYPKSWFYFEVGGFVNRRVSFSVHRVHFLYAMVIVILFSANIPKPIVQHIASDTNTASFQSGIDCHMKSLHWQ